MVLYRTWWTLPGGGLEDGETPEDAAVRELREEAGLIGRAVRVLYTTSYQHGDDYGVLVHVEEDQVPVLGHDPELPADGQHLYDVRWWPLAEMAEDRQVKLVLAAL